MQFKTLMLASLAASPMSVFGIGCYSSWRQGTEYVSGDIVSAVVPLNATAGTTQTKNFRCTSGSQPSLSHCPIYDPSNSQQASAVWSDQGVCSGPLVAPPPTPEPTAARWSGKGCPKEWVDGASYGEGELAEVNGLVYKCSMAQAANIWCGHSSYKPGNSQYWASAWSLLGSCTGTIAPTTSPIFKSLMNAGGCPDEYDSSATYEEGDMVTSDDIVYKCRSWPNSAWCNMDIYAPGGVYSEMAWATLGYCEGTISPTSAPAFSVLKDHNGCPDTYDDSRKYEANDKVSTEVANTHSVVWQCSGDVHRSRYCSQFKPGNDYELAWSLIGYCDGTMSPTSSPNFSKLKEVGNGCPKAYNAATIYKDGEAVSVFLADTPGRAVVYSCKERPSSAYCNAGHHYAPGSDNTNLGWTLKGYCDGTISPTPAPIITECIGYNSTKLITINSWAKTDLWSYAPGTRVSKDGKIYTCRAWPYGLWCKVAAYEPEKQIYWPEEKHVYWGDAWTKSGDCMVLPPPSVLPTVSPTNSPSVPPTTSPTTSPTISPLATPSASPSKSPSASPSASTGPSASPSKSPSSGPSKSPSSSPSGSPSASPSVSPSTGPSTSPSKSPSTSPSKSPTSSPSPPIPRLTASDVAAGDRFGISVSISGNITVVGSTFDDDKGSNSGSAYVFQYSEANGWVQVAKLTASDGAASDEFGISVSVSGSTAVVGSYYDDDKGSNSGSAYVFQYSDANGWVQVAKLTASDGAASDRFGQSVSVSGSTAVIGSHMDDDKGSNSGSAYVFQYSDANGWVQSAKLKASDGAASDFFGWSVSVSGNTAVVGSYGDDDKGSYSGSAYVFRYSDANGWVQSAKLTASDGAELDFFGWSVSVSGNTAVIGSTQDDDKGDSSGSAYVLQYSDANGWVEIAKLTASDGAANDSFGVSVSVSGSTAVIGSHMDDDKGDSSGSAYVFQYSDANGWVEVAKLTAVDGAVNDWFGSSVSVSGNTAVVGSYAKDGNGTDSGAAYFFDAW